MTGHVADNRKDSSFQDYRGNAGTMAYRNEHREYRQPSSNRTRRSQPRPAQRRPSGSRAYAGSPSRARSAQPAAQPLWPIALLALVALLAFISIIANVASCAAGSASQNEGQQAAQPADASSLATSADSPAAGNRVSFVAVGDNVPNDVIADYADACDGEYGDGSYDYRPLFQHVKPYIQAADLAYIDQETHVGGNDLGPSGYPSFNTTDEMADAVVDTGFDLVASATNHAYDWGYFGAIEHSRSVWNSLPVAFTGTAADEEEAAEIPVVERNGITFSLLNYTYGVNGMTADDLPYYAVNFIDEDRIRADVERAKSMSDVVIAAMHWGTENETEPDAEELAWAQLLADEGVDIVLGSHPHVIQPLTWLTGANGNRTLVAYSLGNFIIQHADPTHDNDLEGMLACDFVRVDATSEAASGESATSPAPAGATDASNTTASIAGSISNRMAAVSAEANSSYVNSNGITIQNVRWIPLVYHGEDDAFAVWPLKDYPATLAAKNPAYTDLQDPITWLRQETCDIVNAQGNNFAIDG